MSGTDTRQDDGRRDDRRAADASARRHTAVLVDDHLLVRDAIATILEHDLGVSVVGRFADADASLLPIQRLRPTLALFDVEMPGRSVFDVADQLRRSTPETRIAFLTAHESSSLAAEAKRVGAVGFLHKSGRREHVIASLARLLVGGTAFDSDPTEPSTPLDALTPRQRQVVAYLVRGMSTKEMATTMSLSPRTIGRHVEGIMERWGVHERAKLVVIARGLGTPSPTRTEFTAGTLRPVERPRQSGRQGDT